MGDPPALRAFMENKISLKQAAAQLKFGNGKEIKNLLAILTVLKFSFDYYSTSKFPNFLLNPLIENALVQYLSKTWPTDIVKANISRVPAFSNPASIDAMLLELDALYNQLLAAQATQTAVKSASDSIISEIGKITEVRAADGTKLSLTVGPEYAVEIAVVKPALAGLPALDTSALKNAIPTGTKEFQVGAAHSILAVRADNRLKLFWLRNGFIVTAIGFETQDNVASFSFSANGDSLVVQDTKGTITEKDLAKLYRQQRDAAMVSRFAIVQNLGIEQVNKVSAQGINFSGQPVPVQLVDLKNDSLGIRVGEKTYRLTTKFSAFLDFPKAVKIIVASRLIIVKDGPEVRFYAISNNKELYHLTVPSDTSWAHDFEMNGGIGGVADIDVGGIGNRQIRIISAKTGYTAEIPFQATYEAWFHNGSAEKVSHPESATSAPIARVQSPSTSGISKSLFPRMFGFVRSKRGVDAAMNVKEEDHVRNTLGQQQELTEAINHKSGSSGEDGFVFPQYPADEPTVKTGEEGIDHAMRGGIDLNSHNMQMEVDGDKINAHFDAAMLRQFKQGDFSGIRPVIINITPIADRVSLLGLVSTLPPAIAGQAKLAKQGQLAGL